MHFSEQVHITIDGFTKNIVYYDLKLSQTMMDHHYFSFVWQYTDSPVIKPVDQAAAIRKFEGSEVIFTFKSITGIKLMSKGIITNLKSTDVDGSAVALHVTGSSHTVFLEDTKKSRTFLDRSLKEIALHIFAEETAGEFYQRDAIEPIHSKIFNIKTQYNETSFNFLKRLSARYGEWFYFDGMRIQLGQTKTSKVTLINGASLHNFSTEINLVSHKTSFAGYDQNNATGIKASEANTNTGSVDSFSKMVRGMQGAVSQPNLSIAAYTNQAQNSSEIAEMVKLQTSGRDANSVFYSGISYLPIGVGQIFTIQNKTVEHNVIAIEVVHHSQVHGNYTCEFKAIPSDVTAPHYTDVETFRKAETQSAIVIDNNDPEGMGRVRVEYYWGLGSTKSEWMRVTQQYAGSERGSYCIPEIGDEVLVDFENRNVDCPYVSASHYNGKNKPEFFDSKNMIKGWKFRFGQLLKFIEKVGILLSDPSGNEIHLDEENKSTTITAPETATIRAKNIIFEATESITFRAGTDIFESSEGDKSTRIEGNYSAKIGGDNTLDVTGSLLEHIEGDFNSHTEKERQETGLGGIQNHSEKDINKHAKNNIQHNSGEKTKLN